MKSKNIDISYPLLILAPLSNFSDNGMRVLSKKYGADITYTGMISIYNIIKNDGIDFKILPEERPIAIQIFGKDEELFEKATLILNNFADIIDINFSCPSKKILNSESGGFLLKDFEKIKKIIDRVIKVSKVPVSVKIRSGFKKGDKSYEKIGEICEELDVSYLTIHPRSVTDKFYGDVDINVTKNLKNRVKIPVVHSGEVKSYLDAKKIFQETNCDGIMIGREAIGNPWIFSEIKNYLINGKLPLKVPLDKKIETIKEHLNILINLYNEQYAIKQMKIHIPHYLKGYPGINKLNKLLNGVKSIKELLNLLTNFRFL
ncbi:MAG TPA: tRNA-dihydrouridine synthase [Caldisericia bacterium]|nr:tRNA-dihydrouridine synthase [Caldisericia bacterium]HPC56998.1 tRNA-dihydrouridine synthase [Caldisericia bacterium]HRT37418.1 tRNA-dihydrouridine synthase [Caldisericia bacterium]